MTKFYQFLAMSLILGLLAGCSSAVDLSDLDSEGSANSTENTGGTEDEDQLSTDQINEITATLFDGMLDATESSQNGAFLVAPVLERLSIPVSNVTLCPAAGHITASGNITINEETGAFSSLITFYVSDPTNNLNDCEMDSGIIFDGILYFTMSGDAASFTANLNGSIGINERGSGGGLSPLMSDCGIYISIFSDGSVSGSVCGATVSN